MRSEPLQGLVREKAGLLERQFELGLSRLGFEGAWSCEFIVSGSCLAVDAGRAGVCKPNIPSPAQLMSPKSSTPKILIPET